MANSWQLCQSLGFLITYMYKISWEMGISSTLVANFFKINYWMDEQAKLNFFVMNFCHVLGKL